jgi:hypothetical protein
MDEHTLPAYTGSTDFAQWLDEHVERLLAHTAAFFPASLRKCPLVSDALDGALEPIKADPDRFASLDRLLQEQAGYQLTRMLNNVTSMAANLVRAYPNLSRVREEVPNQVYVHLCEMGPRGWFDPARGGAFWGWLKGVTFHVAMKLLSREQKALRHAPLETASPMVWPEPPDAERLRGPPLSVHQLIDQMVAALPDAVDRRIFTLRFIQNGEVEAIARELEMKPAAVYQRIHRLRQKLRDEGFSRLQGD